MKGTKPIRTVADLMGYLLTCPADAEVTLVPEEGDGFGIGGVLEFHPENQTPQVWILIDEFGDAVSVDLTELGPDDDEDNVVWSNLPETPVPEIEKEDIIKVRGQLRLA